MDMESRVLSSSRVRGLSLLLEIENEDYFSLLRRAESRNAGTLAAGGPPHGSGGTAGSDADAAGSLSFGPVRISILRDWEDMPPV